MMPKSKITLAIESAISGGSIALLCGGREIASWVGSTNVSKAEDLLANIDAILTENKLSKSDIDFIAVSAGPGSFTGIRIGLATALGLKTGLAVNMSSESVLKAMVHSQTKPGFYTPALPVGRNAVCIQSFERKDREIIMLNDPHTLTEKEFGEMVDHSEDSTLILHKSFQERFVALSKHFYFETNLARAVGHLCSENPNTVIEPLFISKSF